MSVGLRYSVVGQTTPHRTRVRELLQLEEALVTDAGAATAGRRGLAAGLIWLAVLLIVGGTVTRQRQRLARLGISPIAASEDNQFEKLSRGSCTSEGLHIISDSAQCKAAAELLGLEGLLEVSPTSVVERPEGCYYFINATDKTRTLWLGTSPESVGKGAETSNIAKGWIREPICQIPQQKPEQRHGHKKRHKTASPHDESPERSKEDSRSSISAFCCFSGRDKEDICGSCWDHAKVFPGSKSKKGKACTKSRGACLECGGEWCGTSSVGDSASGGDERAAGSPHTAESADATSAVGSGEAPSEGRAITMADFKRRIGVSASPADAFLWLDKNGDSSIAWKQFYSGALAFKPPLSRREAKQAFRGLDDNADGLVSKEEFFDAFEAGRFVGEEPVDEGRAGSSGSRAGASARGSTSSAPTTTAAPTTSTAAPTTAPSPSTSTSLETTTEEPESTRTSAAVTSTEAPSAARAATLPAPAPTAPPVPVAQPAPLTDGGVAGWGSTEVPLSASAGAAPGVMSDGSAHPGTTVSVEEFVRRLMATYTSLQDTFGAFDLDGSGCIDRTEFVSAASVLSKPLGADEASQIFTGLDSNHDETVCSHEFFSSLKTGHFVDEGMRGSMSVHMFKERMGSGISPQFAFASLDKAADGGVDFDELLNGRGAFRPPLTKEEARSAFVGFDTDKSNIIESSEFMRAMTAGHFLSPSEHPAKRLTAAEFKQRLGSASPRAAFLALDRDSNGFVGFMEFVGSRKAFMPPLSDLDAQRVFAGMDADRDRRVSLPEFQTVLSTERFFQPPPRPALVSTSWTPEVAPAVPPPGTPMGAPSPPGSSIMDGMPPVR